MVSDGIITKASATGKVLPVLFSLLAVCLRKFTKPVVTETLIKLMGGAPSARVFFVQKFGGGKICCYLYFQFAMFIFDAGTSFAM